MICGLQSVRYTSARLLPGRRAADVRGPNCHPLIAHRTRCLQRRHHSRLGGYAGSWSSVSAGDHLGGLLSSPFDDSHTFIFRCNETLCERTVHHSFTKADPGVEGIPSRPVVKIVPDASSHRIPVRVGRAGCYNAWHLLYFVACGSSAFTGLFLLAAIVILTLSLGVFFKPDTALMLW